MKNKPEILLLYFMKPNTGPTVFCHHSTRPWVNCITGFTIEKREMFFYQEIFLPRCRSLIHCRGTYRSSRSGSMAFIICSQPTSTALRERNIISYPYGTREKQLSR